MKSLITLMTLFLTTIGFAADKACPGRIQINAGQRANCEGGGSIVVSFSQKCMTRTQIDNIIDKKCSQLKTTGGSVSGKPGQYGAGKPGSGISVSNATKCKRLKKRAGQVCQQANQKRDSKLMKQCKRIQSKLRSCK